MRAPSLQDIADATGYSIMTVSRAIRNVGVVSDKARAAILKEADRIGYTYNPEITRMMSLMRSGRRDTYHETVGLIWFTGKEKVRTNYTLRRLVDGIEWRGKELGYKVDSFFFDEYERKAERLCDVLAARGVRGAILGPITQNRGRILENLKMDWSRFAWVAFGNTHTNHEFNRVGHHHFFGVELILRKLERRGYKRPALLVSESLDSTVHHAYLGSFIANHPAGIRKASDLALVGGVDYSDLPGWLRKKRVDALITQPDGDFLEFLEESGFRVGDDFGVATLNQTGDEISGIDQKNEILGAYAVDMLVAQIQRGDVGLPEEPKLMLHKGVWQQGRTTRQRVSGAAAG
jgi:LacI family transcriptional regulator